MGAGTSNYVTARNRVGSTGAFLAAFLDWLNANDLVDYNQVSIVGFSLGGRTKAYHLFLSSVDGIYSTAHVAGFAGKQTQRGKVNTIVGLDPAGLFLLNRLLQCFKI